MYKDSCDFMIGLDTDEFLFSNLNLQNNNDIVSKDNILNIFNNYNINDTLFKIDYYPCSIVDTTNENYINQKLINPARNIIYFSDEMPMSEVDDTMWRYTIKYFVRSNAFLYTTPGNHHISISYGNTVSSSIGYMHYNSTGKRRFFERAKAIIEGYNYFSTSLKIEEQLDLLIINRHNYCMGYHKVNTYHTILLKIYLIKLFIRYIKRLPLIDELDMHISLKFSMLTSNIENEFLNCNEYFNNINKEIINFKEEDINKLIFYDIPIEELYNKYNITKYNFISNLLYKLSILTNVN